MCAYFMMGIWLQPIFWGCPWSLCERIFSFCLIELTVCPDTDCKDDKKNFDCWFFPMFWRTKNVKFHFQWGKKWSNWKHETGNRLWHPFRTYSVSLQARNDWTICLPWNRTVFQPECAIVWISQKIKRWPTPKAFKGHYGPFLL